MTKRVVLFVLMSVVFVSCAARADSHVYVAHDKKHLAGYERAVRAQAFIDSRSIDLDDAETVAVLGDDRVTQLRVALEPLANLGVFSETLDGTATPTCMQEHAESLPDGNVMKFVTTDPLVQAGGIVKCRRSADRVCELLGSVARGEAMRGPKLCVTRCKSGFIAFVRGVSTGR